jgi:hypothetical protein
VAAGHDGPVRLVTLVAAHRRAARGEDHAAHAGPPRRLEDVVRADDVGAQRVLEGHAGLGVGGQVYHGVDAVECGLDGHAVRDVGLERGGARHRATVQRAQLVAVAKRAAQGRPDEPTHPRDQDATAEQSGH